MPDSKGNFKGISLTGKAGEQLDRIIDQGQGSCPFCGKPDAGELCDDDHCREPLSSFTKRLGGYLGC